MDTHVAGMAGTPAGGRDRGIALFEIERIGNAPPEPTVRASAARRPLDGVRVLDLSRVIAAPVAGRTLAQHGADVLAVGAAHLPNIESLVIDTGRGKRSTQLDLRDRSGHVALRELVRGADVFLQAYRPGALAARGLGPQELSDLRPGLIQVSLSAYGRTGPWAQRRGFEQSGAIGQRHRIRTRVRRPVLRLPGSCPARRSTMRPATSLRSAR